MSIRYFVLWCLFGIVLSPMLHAQTVEIPDTTVQRGTVFPLDVLVSDLPEGASTISLTIKYSRLLLLYTEATGGGSRIMQCPTPEVTVEADGAEGTLHITCATVAPATDGVLLTLYFEALAGSSTTAFVAARDLTVNGVTTADVHEGSRVTIPGEPVFPQPVESLSQNYPNPFTWYTTFNYTVTGDTPVEFEVYNLAGRRVAEEDYTLQVGPSTIIFAPEFGMANGAYLMQMTTENGVYQVPFFFIR